MNASFSNWGFPLEAAATNRGSKSTCVAAGAGDVAGGVVAAPERGPGTPANCARGDAITAAEAEAPSPPVR